MAQIIEDSREARWFLVGVQTGYQNTLGFMVAGRASVYIYSVGLYAVASTVYTRSRLPRAHGSTALRGTTDPTRNRILAIACTAPEKRKTNGGLWLSALLGLLGLLFGLFTCQRLPNPLDLGPVEPREVGCDQKDQNGYRRKHGK